MNNETVGDRFALAAFLSANARIGTGRVNKG